MNLENFELKKVEVDKVDIVAGFNMREDYGFSETLDLEQSISETNLNIQPIIVFKKSDNRFGLISGERRLKTLKNLKKQFALAIIFNDLTDSEKLQLMLHENLGRKNFTWQEELKAIKKLKTLGYEINVNTIQDSKKCSKRKVWTLIEALKAVEEYPQLLLEKTRKGCILKYKKLKREEEGFDKISDISLKSVLEENDKKNKKIDSMLIEELKEEVEYYKIKSQNIIDLVNNYDKQERLEKGIWLENEVQGMIEAAKTCEAFGDFNENEKECKICKEKTFDIFSKCEYYKNELCNKDKE